jgi:hypothetical protein
MRTDCRGFLQYCIAFNADPFKICSAAFSASGFIILLILTGGQAFAEWVEIGKSDDGVTLSMIYADPDTIRRKADLVKMWYLLDYSSRLPTRPGMIWSHKAQIEVDCGEERARTLAFTAFSGNMGTGKVIYRDLEQRKWEPVASGSLGQTLSEVACIKP